MIRLAPIQVFSQLVKKEGWTKQQDLIALYYITANIDRINAFINQALIFGAKSIRLNIPGID